MSLTANTISDISALLIHRYRGNTRKLQASGIENQLAGAVYSAENTIYELIAGCLTKVKWGSPKIMLKMEVMHIVSFEI